MKRLVISMSLVVGAAVSVLAPGAPARACSQVPCGPQIVVPPRLDSLSFPSNAVNFATGSGYPGPTLPRIFDASGAVVPASGKKPSAGRATVFSPDVELPPGNYALEYDPRCLPWAGAPPPPPGLEPLPKATVVAFRVGSPEPPPTTAGMLTVVERGTSEESLSTFVRLRLVPSREMLSYMPSTTWTVTVDGKTFWDGNRVSKIFPDYLTLDCVPGRTEVQLNSCGYVSEVVAGSHQVVMKAVVAGLDAQPAPIELTVDVPCGGEPTGDGGVKTDAVPSPAVPTDAVTETTAAAVSDDGCAVAPRGPDRVALLVALASLMALGARRRRKGRS